MRIPDDTSARRGASRREPGDELGRTACVLVTELGPNPAALTEALWALARDRSLPARAAYVLTSTRGEHYLERELLAPGAAYDQLQEMLGDDLVARHDLHVTVVRDAAGEPIEDELSPKAASAWNEARWQNARRALLDARDAPVVYALAGGRRRTSGAMTTVLFQLLARPQDIFVDVRVGDRRVEGARAGFYFPGQRDQRLEVDGAPLFARDVPVHLVEVQVPRLRRLLAGSELATWADALAAGQRAVDDVPTLTLTLDLAESKVLVNDVQVKMAEAELIWFAALVLARKQTEEGWLRGDDLEPTLDVLRQMQVHRQPGWKPSAKVWQRVFGGKFEHDDMAILSKHRSHAVKRFKTALAAMGLPAPVVLRSTPVREKRQIDGGMTTCWRLPIDPDSIRLR